MLAVLTRNSQQEVFRQKACDPRQQPREKGLERTERRVCAHTLTHTCEHRHTHTHSETGPALRLRRIELSADCASGGKRQHRRPWCFTEHDKTLTEFLLKPSKVVLKFTLRHNGKVVKQGGCVGAADCPAPSAPRRQSPYTRVAVIANSRIEGREQKASK